MNKVTKAKLNLPKQTKLSQNKISTQQNSSQQMDCSCQILNDTSLSNVSDSSCSCSECLQANLNAFNELKQIEQRQKLERARSLDKYKDMTESQIKQQQGRRNQKRSSTRYGKASNVSLSKRQLGLYGQQDGTKKYFTKQFINDYILITQQRTRQYLNQRNKIDKQNRKAQQQLKKKIKQNLQILKYTTKVVQQKDKNQKDIQGGKQQFKPSYKWNHAPAISRQLKQIRKSRKQCKLKLSKRKAQRKKVDTNLQKFIPGFQENHQSIIKQAKSRRIANCQQHISCQHGHCSMNKPKIPKQKLVEFENFVKEKVKKYHQKKENHKRLKEQKQKTKKAKLRAIQLKAKKQLQQSKKYDPTQSRTTFRLTIDHFSTFSELRINKQQKDQQKQHRKQVKKMMKQKGGAKLQQAIYEDVFQQFEHGQQKPHQKHQLMDKYSSPIQQTKKQYYQKITKDAKIHSPKKLKPQDQSYLKQKQQKKKKNLPMNPQQEKKKTKQIQLEIQRKKRELMQQYKKQQQLKESKNQKLKNSHKEALGESRR